MSERIDALPEGLVDDLARPAGYPLDEDAGAGIEHIQTHLSHVFLLARRVYKLHKAAALGFVDFGLREARNTDCVDEVRLNRRLASDVYLGVAPIEVGADGRYRVGERIDAPTRLDPMREHCVVMQRLEPDRDALSLLERGELTRDQLERVSAKIARFHAGLEPIDTGAAGDVVAPAQANLAAIDAAGDDVVPTTEAVALRRATEARLSDLAGTFERRRRAGRIVEGHGDLHLQHVWLPSDARGAEDPPIIDCLEFSEALRVTDVAAEIAFLAMDLAYRGAGALAELFVRRYAEATGDFDLYSTIDLYVAHRATVRAKVAALAASDPEIEATQRAASRRSARRHVAFARRALAPRTPGHVVLVGGVIATGKSTAARALGDRIGAVVVSSDRVRKARLGLRPTDRLTAEPGAGAYTPEARAAVYDAMLEAAAPIIASGRTVVLDATWSSRDQRERARAFANRAGAARCLFIETRCDVDVLRARLAERRARNDDASDAGPELLDASLDAFDALDEHDPWPRADRAVIDTGRVSIDTAIAATAHDLGLDDATVWD